MPHPAARLRDSRTGVFMGLSNFDYYRARFRMISA